MGATVSEIAGGPADPHPLVKGVGTKRLGKGRVKGSSFFSLQGLQALHFLSLHDLQGFPFLSLLLSLNVHGEWQCVSNHRKNDLCVFSIWPILATNAFAYWEFHQQLYQQSGTEFCAQPRGYLASRSNHASDCLGYCLVLSEWCKYQFKTTSISYKSCCVVRWDRGW